MNGPGMTPRFLFALEVAARLFDGRYRDMGNVPYIAHLTGVCFIVRQFTDDEDVCIAGLLHDVLEDIPPNVYSAVNMERDFGERVTMLVRTVSHDEVRHDKDEARRYYLRQLQDGPVEACLISGADMFHNGQDIVSWWKRDIRAAKCRFTDERAIRRSWFWHSRFTIICERLGVDHPLVAEVRSLFRNMEAIGQMRVQYYTKEKS